MKKDIFRKKFILTLVFIALLLFAVSGIVYFFDPFFHYHKPYDGISYILDNERYQDHGIAENFEYDTVITGTSMCENFSASLCDSLFSAKTVKIPMGGAYYKEAGEFEGYILSKNPSVKRIIRSVDLEFALYDKDYSNPDAPAPVYLYDENIFNDVEYLFNKDVHFYYIPNMISRSIKGEEPDDFDSFMRFQEFMTFSKEKVLSTVKQVSIPSEQRGLTAEEEQMLRESIEQNFIPNVAAHPEVEFYYFIPPYSAAWIYKEQLSKGRYGCFEEMMELFCEELLPYENVKLFCFYDCYDTVTDLDKYTDVIHYSADINDMILESMTGKKHLLTPEGYNETLSEISGYYEEYDYDEMFK